MTDADLIEREITQKFFIRDLTPDEKLRVIRKAKWRCFYCGKRVGRNKGHVDHKLPWRKGWPTTIKNSAWSCISCNITKGKNADKAAPFNAVGLWMRKLHGETLGPENWGQYEKKFSLLKEIAAMGGRARRR